jgi:hypothetical protein
MTIVESMTKHERRMFMALILMLPAATPEVVIPLGRVAAARS